MTNYTISTPTTNTPSEIYGLLGVGTDNTGRLLDPSSLGGAATITLTAPTGFSVAGSPLTGSGTLALSFAAGYALPTTTKQTQWDTAFGWGNHASAGYLTGAAIGSSVLAFDSNLQTFVTNFTLPSADGTNGQVLTTNGAGTLSLTAIPYSLIIACSGTTQPLAVGTAKETFRVDQAFTLTGVRASLTTAATGSTVIVDINLNGTSVLGTKLSIDATETTSTTAASAATITTSAIPLDGEITIDIDQVGATTPGAGLKVYLLGALV